MLRSLLLIFSFIIGIIFNALIIPAQSILVLSPDKIPCDLLDNPNTAEIKLHHKIKFIGANTDKVKMKVDVINITEGHAYQFCDLNNCYPPQTANFEPLYGFDMSPGQETDDNFYLLLIPNNVIGTTSLKVTFFMVNNPADFSEYTVNFIIQPTDVGNFLTPVADGLKMASPNPASKFVLFKYELSESASTSEIVIYNSLGKQVDKILLSSKANSVMYDCSRLPAGVYFYSMKVNGKSTGTEKLIITK